MDKLKKIKTIDALKAGDKVKDIFIVKFKKGMAPYSKGYYFTVYKVYEKIGLRACARKPYNFEYRIQSQQSTKKKR